MNPESPERHPQQNFDPHSGPFASGSQDHTVPMVQKTLIDDDEDYAWAKSSDSTYDQSMTGSDPSEHDVFLGRTIGEHYQILNRLGSGGMSVVYKARHTLLHRNMAVKFLLPDSDFDSKTLSRFQQEAKAAFSLNHPNIARVNELGVDSGSHPYIVMDFVEGPTFGDLIEKNGKLPVDRTLRLLSQACDGLQHAHSKDVVHRDIKPGNLIVTTEGKEETIKIVDFGIAKIMHEAEGTQHLTQTGEVFGSPLYMSPEQAMGKPLDCRTDVYAMGCVMYEALSGQPPFRGQNILDTLSKHINEDPEDLKEVPVALKVIVKKAMEKNPRDRYQSMAELKHDIDAVLEGRQSRLTSTYKLLVKPKTRKFVMPVLAILLVIVGALAWSLPQVAASPRFEHRSGLSWMWTPEPKSDNQAPKTELVPPAAEEGTRSLFGNVLDEDVKDKAHLTALSLAADKLYEKDNPTDEQLKKATDYYAKGSEMWDQVVESNSGADWDRAMLESRLGDCYRMTGDLDKALPHYKIAKPLWAGLGDAAKQNDAMCAMYIAYIESKQKSAMSMSPAAVWDQLSSAFAGNKYLGVVRQDWSNVQWNLGSPIDAEASRVQAIGERSDASKKPYSVLPLSNPQ